MTMRERLDGLLGSATERGDVPGVVALVTNRDGVVYEEAFGERALGGGTAMSTDTVVWLASMTKAIAGAAAMQLVEQGKLSLDAPAGDLIPELAAVQVLEGFDADEAPILRVPKTPVTLRQLLTHTAGFGYETWHEPIKRFAEATNIPNRGTGKRAALGTPLMFDPGDRWEYSIAIDWAGLMVEAVSGQKLGKYLAANILEPLGMTSTGFKITQDMESRIATVHQRGEDGLTPAPKFRMKQDPEVEAGGGGLYSTVGDYGAFTRMILNKGYGNGNQILKPETVEMMSVNQMGDCRVVELKSSDPTRSLDAEFFPGVPKTWGLSFMINEEGAPTGRPAGSLSWAGLGNSYFWIDPKNGIAGVYATQILPFVDIKSLPLFLDFETAVYQNLDEMGGGR
ncbi:MAG: serine hydrolase [Alphaproteobacteria bacterium]|nr:serine hydrolase [Alphaproteobacteria bacterium]